MVQTGGQPATKGLQTLHHYHQKRDQHNITGTADTRSGSPNHLNCRRYRPGYRRITDWVNGDHGA